MDLSKFLDWIIHFYDISYWLWKIIFICHGLFSGFSYKLLNIKYEVSNLPWCFVKISSAVKINQVVEFVFQYTAVFYIQYTAKPVLVDTKGTEEKCPL